MCFSNKKQRKAFALSIVLWIVAALMLGIAFIMGISKETIHLTRMLQDKTTATIEAQNMLEILKFQIPTANHDARSFILTNKILSELPDKIIPDGRKYHVNHTTFYLRDTSSLFNVLSPVPLILSELTTDTRELRFTLQNSLSDWMDEDGTVRLNGAEEAYYRIKKNVAFLPRNTPAIQSPDELRIIKGFDTLPIDQWKKLKQQLYYGKKTPRNLTLLTPKQLSVILQIDRRQAEIYTTIRSEDLPLFIRTVSGLKTFYDESMDFRISNHLHIHIETQVGEGRYVIDTLIDFRSNAIRPFTIERYQAF